MKPLPKLTSLAEASPKRFYREVLSALAPWRIKAAPNNEGRAMGYFDEKWDGPGALAPVVFLVPRGHEQFRLQVVLQEQEKTKAQRVKIFGIRTSTGSRVLAYNTQAATFSSDHRAGTYFYLRPVFTPVQREIFQRLMPPGSGLPFYQEKKIYLGATTPRETIAHFIAALAAIESVKCGEVDGSTLPDLRSVAVVTVSDLELFSEGELQTASVSRRKRSASLRAAAARAFKSASPDGQLRCCLCGWASPIATAGEVIQIHHENPVASLPIAGHKIKLADALRTLFPLCPNCHCILHSKPGGGNFRLEELKQIFKPSI